MDDGRFDDLARALSATGTRRAGIRAALGAVLGLGIAGAARDADAKRRSGRDVGAAKRRHECGPDAPCPANFTCVKQGRKRRCVCATTTCGASCCAAGEICQNGTCVTPGPDACAEFGRVCKNVGVPCCDGLVCGSGQGGEGDVACYVPAGGGCATTAECTYGSQCLMGLCVANPQPAPDDDDPVVECVPTVAVTDDPATNGSRLQQAFADAATQADSVIVLASGEYLMDVDQIGSDDYGVLWDTPNKVTVKTCPDAQITVKPSTAGSRMFWITDGGMTLVGPGLTFAGDGASTTTFEVDGDAGGSPLLVLKEVVVTSGDTGVLTRGGGEVEIDGGSVSGDVNRFIWWQTENDSKLTCTPNPLAGTGACDCQDGSGTCTGCCDSWT